MYVAADLQKKMRLNNGSNLYDQTFEQNILLVFLRHFGCVFCKEALRDLASIKTSIEKKGVKIIFVHMATNEIADKYFKEFGFVNALQISDPDKEYYRIFGLRKGSFTQLYGLQTWVRGFASENKNNKLEVSKSLGDATQMPGIFYLAQGKILDSYIHKLAADKPDYYKMVECCLIK